MSSGLTAATDQTLARGQLQLFHELGMICDLTADDQRRLLSLSDPEWQAWRHFLRGGPLPVRPSVPDMLLRLAVAAYGISVAIDADFPFARLGGW